jgi:hypothetical protein
MPRITVDASNTFVECTVCSEIMGSLADEFYFRGLGPRPLCTDDNERPLCFRHAALARVARAREARKSQSVKD